VGPNPIAAVGPNWVDILNRYRRVRVSSSRAAAGRPTSRAAAGRPTSRAAAGRPTSRAARATAAVLLVDGNVAKVTLSQSKCPRRYSQIHGRVEFDMDLTRQAAASRTRGKRRHDLRPKGAPDANSSGEFH
jgi:hypothetical protein